MDGIFTRFTRMHDGWLVTAQHAAPHHLGVDEAHDVRLREVAVERHGAGKGSSLVFTLADARGNHRTHVIQKPVSVTVLETDEGLHKALRIEETSGMVTVLNFQNTARADSLDGIATIPWL
ncbi:MAG: hypothetical protein FJX76_27965, partial [Armatimonadetes bacterium]|nr:hypothetical protein [Armatimonadota bacterium]